MEHKHLHPDQEIDQAIESLREMRRFGGPPNEFWPAFLEGLAHLTGATLGLLLLQGEEDGPWRHVCVWPARGRRLANTAGLDQKVDAIADAAVEQGCTWEDVAAAGKRGPDNVALGVRLELEEDRASVAVLLVSNHTALAIEEAATRLRLVADVPAGYQQGRVVEQARNDVVQFAEALDLMVLLNEQKRYMGAAMTFCNELASRYRCARVSLGWLQGGYVRVQAVSHIERFEKKMDAVQALEAAMEETFDQDEEILWPQPEGNTAVTRDHEAFSREQGVNHLVSLPIRLDDGPAGVLVCERADRPFEESEVRGLRVHCDQAARRLDDLKRTDRWFGARMAAGARNGLSKLVGVEHTFAKCLGIVVFCALAFLLFGRLNYRVEAPFIVRTDDLAYLPSPFDGYIDEVLVEVGDHVDESAVLLTLDNSELLLEESTALANRNRYSREAEKARAQNALADMKIALALKEQSESQLELVRYHLNHAQVRAPFAGIVVEGDLDELLGAPVKKGDVLFKVARIEKMYAELEVDERDVHEVAAGATGEIAFVSRPKLKFPIEVERIDPVAVAKEEGNVFLMRCTFTGEALEWWRPGMSGVSKINVGKRNVLWILTHRSIDFFRILLWW